MFSNAKVLSQIKHFFNCLTMKFHLYISISLSVFIFFPFTSFAQTHTPKYITVCSNIKGFYEYLPKGYQPSDTLQYPLIIFSHGAGETGNGSAANLPKVLANGTPKQIKDGIFPDSFFVNGQHYKFIVLSPQYVAWPSVGHMDTLINYAIANYKVDTSRIYLTGLSMGGGITWNYAADSFKKCRRIAAIVPVCGATGANTYRGKIMAVARLPVWATHNNGDPTVPDSTTTNMVNFINANKPAPLPIAIKTTFISNSHNAWSATYNLSFRPNGLNVYEWLLTHKRPIFNYWIGPSNGAWENSTYWSRGFVPNLSSETVIDRNNPVKINSIAHTKRLHLYNGGRIIIEAGQLKTSP